MEITMIVFELRIDPGYLVSPSLVVHIMLHISLPQEVYVRLILFSLSLRLRNFWFQSQTLEDKAKELVLKATEAKEIKGSGAEKEFAALEDLYGEVQHNGLLRKSVNWFYENELDTVYSRYIFMYIAESAISWTLVLYPWTQFLWDDFSQNLLIAIAFVPVGRRKFFTKSTLAFLSVRAETHPVQWSAMLGRALAPPLCRRVGSIQCQCKLRLQTVNLCINNVF